MRFFRPVGDLKGWQRFGFEVAIIIVGLGITLIAQELISEAARARQTRQAMDAVEVEIMSNYAYASERLAVEPCRREQIRALAEQIQNANGTWAGYVPENINRNSETMVLPRVYRVPIRQWSDGAWTAFLDSDAAIELDRQQFAHLSIMFRGAQMYRDKQEDSFRLAGRLSNLAMSGPLDATQRREAYALLGELAAIEGLMTIHAQQFRDMVDRFEFKNRQRFARFGPTGDFGLEQVIARDIEHYGTCVDTTQFQTFVDELNATTGMRFVIPTEAAP